MLNQVKSIDTGLKDSCFFARYWLGIDLNPFQERVLKQIDGAMWGGEYNKVDLIETIMHAGNRTGKTVLLSIIHIKFAYYKIGIQPGPGYDEFKYRTFGISPISRQAKECLKYIEDILEGRFTWTKDGVRYSNRYRIKLKNFFEGKNENIGELRYSNRSVTYAFSTGADMGTGFQGLPAGIVTYDECVLSHHLEDELDSNVYSRLGDYGKLMMLIATPNEEGKSQQYFHHLITEAKNGSNNFLVMGGSYMENVFIDVDKRESHKQTLLDRDPIMARQILYGDFVSTGGTVFDTPVIERLWNGSKVGKEPQNGHQYMISVDWGMAEGGDETVFLVWDITVLPVEIVWAYGKKGGDPYELMGILRSLILDYNNAVMIMDTGALGGTIMKKLLKDTKPISFDAGGVGDAKANAITYAKILMTKNRKKRMIEAGVEADEEKNFGWIRSFYLAKLANQLATYKIDDKTLKQDWVSAFYIGASYIWKIFGDKQHQQKSYHMNPFRKRTTILVKQKI